MKCEEQPDFLTLRSQGTSSAIVPYSVAWDYQKTLVEKRIRDEIPDTWLFVEHPSTITRGRGLQWSPDRGDNPRAVPLSSILTGTEYFEIERGGDLTWHGPGQITIYPIVKLDGSGIGPCRDVTGWIRRLEKIISNFLRHRGVQPLAKENATGVWVEEDRKIASIGIAVRKWVSYHGVGLNISNSFEGFKQIAPCGFSPDVMTSLDRVEKKNRNSTEWREKERAVIEMAIATEVLREVLAIRSDSKVSMEGISLREVWV